MIRMFTKSSGLALLRYFNFNKQVADHGCINVYRSAKPLSKDEFNQSTYAGCMCILVQVSPLPSNPPPSPFTLGLP